MGRSKVERPAALVVAHDEAARYIRGVRRPIALATWLVATSASLAPSLAWAQHWGVEAGIRSQLTWSSNPELGSADGRNDVILDLTPHFTVRAEGARLRLDGTAALNGVASANGTQPNRVLPQADLNARLEAVQRFFFIDAGLRAVQTAENPFGVRPEADTSRNTITTAQVHVAPSIESDLSTHSRYRLRSENSWTRDNAPQASLGTQAAGYFGRHSALFERDPIPLGWRVEAQRSQTRYRDGFHEPLTFDLARLTASYALGVDLTAGVRVGRERTSVLPENENTENLYGVEASWHPSPRTALTLFDEKRFFGSSWRLGFDHRMSRVAWNLALSRTLDTSPQALLDLPVENNVSALLDRLFMSRFPDPATRAVMVQDLIARQGLPSSTAQPLTIYTQRLSIVTLRSLGVVLTGRRSTLSLAGFRSRTEDLPGALPLLTSTVAANNRQYGASAAWSHQLTPVTTVSTSGDWTRISALQAADRSTQRTLRVQVNAQLAPRTQTFAGVRYRDLKSNVATEGREGALFAGLDHRF
jgi:uncharacterized protein (PEP-CTERM system associated)